jgi:hypothetical protein
VLRSSFAIRSKLKGGSYSAILDSVDTPLIDDRNWFVGKSLNLSCRKSKDIALRSLNTSSNDTDFEMVWRSTIKSIDLQNRDSLMTRLRQRLQTPPRMNCGSPRDLGSKRKKWKIERRISLGRVLVEE